MLIYRQIWRWGLAYTHVIIWKVTICTKMTPINNKATLSSNWWWPCTNWDSAIFSIILKLNLGHNTAYHPMSSNSNPASLQLQRKQFETLLEMRGRTFNRLITWFLKKITFIFDPSVISVLSTIVSVKMLQSCITIYIANCFRVWHIEMPRSSACNTVKFVMTWNFLIDVCHYKQFSNQGMTKWLAIFNKKKPRISDEKEVKQNLQYTELGKASV